MVDLDLIIRHGAIYDGAGNPWFRADIGIRKGQIMRVGPLSDVTASEYIEADGLTVTPGFFDVHTHSDFSLLANPFPKSQLLQGVTSEVEGHCGYSAFPLVGASHGFLFEPKDMAVDWSTAAEYFERLINAQPGVNTAVCVGHTIIRAAVSGREDRKVTDNELEQMKSLVRQAMEAGAIGLSTGLDYPPGGSADTNELIALCKVVAEYGGVYTTHIRGHTDNFVNAVAEAIDIGHHSRVAVQISHFGAAGPHNLERTRQALGLIDHARDQGVDVMIDVIPYGTAGSWWAPRAIFPAWAYDWRVNNLEHVRDLLLDPVSRARLREEVEERRAMEKHGFEQEMVIFSDWSRIILAEVKPESEHAHLVGKDMLEIGRLLDKDPRDAYFDLLVAEYPIFSTVRFVVDEKALIEMLQKPYAMIGSDSVATSPEVAGETFNVLQPHPRNYGCFPHVLGDLVRDQGIMTWEDAIRKMTSLPAQRFGFTNRGLVRQGMQADLVVFDRAKIGPQSTWRQPGLLPQGIHHVLVNGSFAVRDWVATDIRAGQVVQWKA